MASNSIGKTWARFVPFTRSWHERWNARRQAVNTETTSTPNPSLLDTVNNAESEGDEDQAARGPAEMAGIAVAERQQMVAPTQNSTVNQSPNLQTPNMDNSGGASEPHEPPVLPSSSRVPIQQTSPLQVQQATPAPATAPAFQARATVPAQTRTATAPAKSLAQYGHHDNKGAVGWVVPTPSPHRSYPQRQYVTGQKVLAQYGHNTDKWAVKHSIY